MDIEQSAYSVNERKRTSSEYSGLAQLLEPGRVIHCTTSN